MKLFFSGLFAIVFVFSAQAQTDGKLANQTDSLSYALGMDIGRNLSSTEMDLNTAQIYKGLLDALAGETQLSDQEKMELIRTFQQQAAALQQQKKEEKALKPKVGYSIS